VIPYKSAHDQQSTLANLWSIILLIVSYKARLKLGPRSMNEVVVLGSLSEIGLVQVVESYRTCISKLRNNLPISSWVAGRRGCE